MLSKAYAERPWNAELFSQNAATAQIITYFTQDEWMSNQLIQRNATTEKWARIWFEKLARFHRIADPDHWIADPDHCVVDPDHWRFDEEHVVSFLIDRKKTGVPTWKRIKIIEGLIQYRNKHARSSAPKRETLRSKLAQLRDLDEIVTEKRHPDSHTLVTGEFESDDYRVTMTSDCTVPSAMWRRIPNWQAGLPVWSATRSKIGRG